MVPVAEAEGVKLNCPEKGRYAFFNSPFPAHQLNTGVDLYPSSEWGGEAFSPVDGEVEHIRIVKAPKGHGFEAADHDTVMVVRNKANPETVTKLLHADPLVEVGDAIRVGDVIGTTLRSGYYGRGTSAHFHAEIRTPEDAIRARGGFNLRRVDEIFGKPQEELVGEVVVARPEYTMIRVSETNTGLVGSVEGAPAILDGGIPYYGWMGAHMSKPPRAGEIQLLGKTVADITEAYEGACIGVCNGYNFSVDGEPIIGLALSLQPRSEALVKVLFGRRPVNPSIGDWIEVTLNT
jgi:murein DD-endopeptidase MepM/ murein hydrolase activator NlpD